MGSHTESGLGAHVGKRITIRLHEDSGGFRDIVGVLESETTLRNKHNEIIEFSPSDIAISRVIKELPTRAGTGAPLSHRIHEIEDICMRTWPPTKIESLGKWQMRTSGKFTMRANSVLPQGAAPYGQPGCDIEQAIIKVIEHYKKENLTPIFHLPLPTYSALDSALEKLGWKERVRAHVMVADITNFHVNLPSGFEMNTSSEFDESWLEVQDDHGVAEIMRSYPALYSSISKNGTIVAVGRTAQCEKWTSLARIYVAPEMRGMGLGKAIVSELLNSAAAHSATQAVLQVDSNNQGAIALYESLGFRFHHEYIFRAHLTSLDILEEECC
ncbi:unannotated protein [freshwater metagenome]|uniref:Unannotated protein n=1 Tax=freshwater metagenome TaxID=449393 RepID=A0A6J7XQF1_9ZZZZ|nr:GNAT family N-acetyltransferase [Actinomycetota bacterium]